MPLKGLKSPLKKSTLYRERSEEKRKKFLESLEKIPVKDRIYLDESGINRYMFRGYGRSPRGEKVVGEVSGHRFARESFISALSEGKFLAPMCFQGTCNTELFNAWLKKVLLPQLPEGKVLILDNATFHRSKESQEIVKKARCSLMYLPPYSPDLNPIEKYWANLKNKVRESLRSLTNFTEALDQSIVSMSI
jgi:transposase